MRNIELQKKTASGQYETELKNKYSDYEDMLRRKRENQKELADE